MKTLFLLRHAKSSWDNASLSDFERPLSGRGLKAAPFMGELMRREGFEPDVIFSSPAMRARQTAEMVKAAGGFAAKIKFEPRIYEASPQLLLEVVSQTDDVYGSAMLVGHNPGIEGFIRSLTDQLEPMPTAGLAVIDLVIINWALIDGACGTLRHIFRPRDEMSRINE